MTGGNWSTYPDIPYLNPSAPTSKTTTSIEISTSKPIDTATTYIAAASPETPSNPTSSNSSSTISRPQTPPIPLTAASSPASSSSTTTTNSVTQPTTAVDVTATTAPLTTTTNTSPASTPPTEETPSFLHQYMSGAAGTNDNDTTPSDTYIWNQGTTDSVELETASVKKDFVNLTKGIQAICTELQKYVDKNQTSYKDVHHTWKDRAQSLRDADMHSQNYFQQTMQLVDDIRSRPAIHRSKLYDGLTTIIANDKYLLQAAIRYEFIKYGALVSLRKNKQSEKVQTPLARSGFFSYSAKNKTTSTQKNAAYERLCELINIDDDMSIRFADLKKEITDNKNSAYSTSCGSRLGEIANNILELLNLAPPTVLSDPANQRNASSNI